MPTPLISQLGLQPTALKGETILVTGAGGGIGYEAARALLWLGANVIIAEINAQAGKQSADRLAEEYGAARVLFVPTDVGDEASVKLLYEESTQRFGRVDVVINNATVAVLGEVKDVPIEKWDFSYRVNLRGPVLLAQAFLPDMLRRGHGIFVCVSSKGMAYLGGYEAFKAAQLHLSDTLDAELEGTGVIAFTIGPGLVPTQTAVDAVSLLAPQMGMSVKEFYELNKGTVLTVEEAGAGFAVSIVFAEKFKGTEISSIQALRAADIDFGSTAEEQAWQVGGPDQRLEAAAMCAKVLAALAEQSEGWKKRSIFERQWVVRDFKKTAGMSAEEWLEALKHLESSLEGNGLFTLPPLSKLAGYYEHLAELARGYEKDPEKLEENLRYVNSWRDEVIALDNLLTGEAR
jgi:NAD(P)-dependent dehydrogenase (short-subunit alcohol dehydrogenase family)